MRSPIALAVIIAVLIYLLVGAVVFGKVRDLIHIPEGYEDETGFHFGPEGSQQPNADAE